MYIFHFFHYKCCFRKTTLNFTILFCIVFDKVLLLITGLLLLALIILFPSKLSPKQPTSWDPCLSLLIYYQTVGYSIVVCTYSATIKCKPYSFNPLLVNVAYRCTYLIIPIYKDYFSFVETTEVYTEK